VALLLAGALVFNLAMLPYAIRFKVVMPGALVIACRLGIRYGKRPDAHLDRARPSNPQVAVDA